MGQLEAMGDEISFIQRVHAEQFDTWTSLFLLRMKSAPAKTGKMLATPARDHRSLRLFGK